MTDLALYMSDVAKKPSPTGQWLNGPKISAEDLKRGRNGVEKISQDEAMAPGGGPAPKPEYRSWSPIEKKSPAKPAGGKGEPLMGFGKHRDKAMKWVRDNEPGYWEWCLENIDWFAGKVEKAGL